MVKIKFSSRDCQRYLSKLDCTTASRRTVTLHAREQFEALEGLGFGEDAVAARGDGFSLELGAGGGLAGGGASGGDASGTVRAGDAAGGMSKPAVSSLMHRA
jgi:hypothetical protein